MVNYDDIFDSQQPNETGAGTQFSSFDKESWAAQKQQDRDSAYSMIEQTAQRMAVSGELFKSFLNVQSRFDRYSVGNALLITAPDIFRSLSSELAHAHLDKGDYKRSENAFTAYCVSYILCMRNNIAKDTFRFERLPESLSTMDAQKVRAELGKIREVANEISADMKHYLDKAKPPKTRDDGAR